MTDSEEKSAAVEGGLVRGVLYLPFTENLELAKRVRERLNDWRRIVV